MADHPKRPPHDVFASLLGPSPGADQHENGDRRDEPPHAGTQEVGLEAALNLIAEQAQLISRASGAAIALKSGELMVCRARAGEMAPDIGSRLDISSGLSGECVRTGQVLRCGDTESDRRVDLAVCRHLGVRSIVVMPLLLEQRIVGVFEVFSPQPAAFGDAEVAALESMRDLIVSAVRPSPAPHHERAVGATTGETAAAAGIVNLSIPVPRSKASLTAVKIFGQDFEIPESFVGSSTGNENLDRQIFSGIPSAKHSKQKLLARERKNNVPQKKNGEPSISFRGDSIGQHAGDDLVCEIEERGRIAALCMGAGLGTFAPSQAELMPPPEPWISRKLIVAGGAALVLGLVWLGWGGRSENPKQLSNTQSPADANAVSVPSSSNTESALAKPAPASALTAIETEQLPPPAPAESSKATSWAEPSPSKANKSAPGEASALAKRTVTRPSAGKPTPTKVEESEASVAKNHVGEPDSAQAAIAPTTKLPIATNPASPAASATPEAVASGPPAESPKQNKHHGIDLSQGVVSTVRAPRSSNNSDADVLQLLETSAKAGDPNAQLALAVRYADGNGVRQSYSEAMKWFAKAEAQGVFAQDSKAKDARKRAGQFGQ
jgi:hypothetical protein